MKRIFLRIVCFFTGHKKYYERYWHAGYGDEVVVEYCKTCDWTDEEKKMTATAPKEDVDDVVF